MRRREFIALISGATVAWPGVARAQGRAQQAHPRIIGALVIGNADVPSFTTELREGLRELGRIEGTDYRLELRSAEGQLSRLPKLAQELVQLKTDVIVALFTPCALAAKQATKDIPIVILSGDPLGTGLVSNLSRPDGNVTGLSQMAAETTAKGVELFRDMLPSATRVALFTNGADPVFAKTLIDHARQAGVSIGLAIEPIVKIKNSDEIAAAFRKATDAKANAVVFQGSLPTQRMADLSLSYRLPASTGLHQFAEVGGLMSYGADGPALFRRAATFVDKLLKGEIPGNLPVEQTTKFQLVLNLKTAKSLGITIPPTLIARADEVIE